MKKAQQKTINLNRALVSLLCLNIKDMTNSDITKKGMVEALTKSLGIVSTACESVGISRQTHYRWLSEDPEYKQHVDDISEMAIDFVESKLHEKIEGVTMGKVVDGRDVIYDLAPSDKAIIFFLKTKAKKRGYVERQEVQHSGEITTITGMVVK